MATINNKNDIETAMAMVKSAIANIEASIEIVNEIDNQYALGFTGNLRHYLDYVLHEIREHEHDLCDTNI